MKPLIILFFVSLSLACNKSITIPTRTVWVNTKETITPIIRNNNIVSYTDRVNISFTDSLGLPITLPDSLSIKILVDTTVYSYVIPGNGIVIGFFSDTPSTGKVKVTQVIYSDKYTIFKL